MSPAAGGALGSGRVFHEVGGPTRRRASPARCESSVSAVDRLWLGGQNTGGAVQCVMRRRGRFPTVGSALILALTGGLPW